MKQELQSRCELFIENRHKLQKTSGIEYYSIYTVASNVLTSKNVEADQDKLKACRKLLKEKTGVFSAFRGNITLPLVSMLALDDDPQGKMDRAASLYKQLSKEFSASDCLPLAAMMLTDMVSDDEAEKIIERSRGIYRLMKKDHPFLTGSEDSVFAVLMAFSDKSDTQLLSDMEQVYEEMKAGGFNSYSSLAVSRVFALTGGYYSDNCAKIRKVLDLLKDQGRKYEKSYEMGVLAGLVSLPVPAETLVEEMLEVDAFLSKQKGYGFLGYDKKSRLMHAAMILSGFYSDEGSNRGAELSAITGTISMVATMQVVLIAAVATGSAIAAGSSSNS